MINKYLPTLYPIFINELQNTICSIKMTLTTLEKISNSKFKFEDKTDK